MSNTLHASYDEANNRVVLTLDTDPGVTDMSILRHEGDGSLRPLPSLLHCPRAESGFTVLYDWTAPLNRLITYQALFFNGDAEVPTDSPVWSAVATLWRAV